MTPRYFWLAVLLTALLACAGRSSIGGGTPTFGSPDTTSKVRKSVVVNVTQAYLAPRTARIYSDGNVVWENLTGGDLVAQVIFPMSIVDSLTCTELRPRWYKASDTVRSIPFTGGGESLVTPCGHGSGHGGLKPGEYDYEVWLYTGGALAGVTLGADLGDPATQLKGKIVVEQQSSKQ